MSGLKEAFEGMGAQVLTEDLVVRRRINEFRRRGRALNMSADGPPILDMRLVRARRRVIIDMLDNPAAKISVLDVQPKLRHLLLSVKTGTESNQFLMGHDERHWFVASLPNQVHLVLQRFNGYRRLAH
jgi:hypothetical protein